MRGQRIVLIESKRGEWTAASSKRATNNLFCSRKSWLVSSWLIWNQHSSSSPCSATMAIQMFFPEVLTALGWHHGKSVKKLYNTSFCSAPEIFPHRVFVVRYLLNLLVVGPHFWGGEIFDCYFYEFWLIKTIFGSCYWKMLKKARQNMSKLKLFSSKMTSYKLSIFMKHSFFI